MSRLNGGFTNCSFGTNPERASSPLCSGTDVSLSSDTLPSIKAPSIKRLWEPSRGSVLDYDEFTDHIRPGNAISVQDPRRRQPQQTTWLRDRPLPPHVDSKGANFPRLNAAEGTKAAKESYDGPCRRPAALSSSERFRCRPYQADERPATFPIPKEVSQVNHEIDTTYNSVTELLGAVSIFPCFDVTRNQGKSPAGIAPANISTSRVEYHVHGEEVHGTLINNASSYMGGTSSTPRWDSRQVGVNIAASTRFPPSRIFSGKLDITNVNQSESILGTNTQLYATANANFDLKDEETSESSLVLEISEGGTLTSGDITPTDRNSSYLQQHRTSMHIDGIDVAEGQDIGPWIGQDSYSALFAPSEDPAHLTSGDPFLACSGGPIQPFVSNGRTKSRALGRWIFPVENSGASSPSED